MSATLQSTAGVPACLGLFFIAHCGMAQTGGPADGEANREASPAPAISAETPAYVAITQNERLRYYFHHLFSLESAVRSAAGAGINQALNTAHEWGQGAEGYGRRYASSYGGHIVQQTVMYGASSVLHEDNRYFRSGETGFRARLKYAIESAFLARHADGSRHISISGIGSYAAAAMISRAWQPPSTIGPQHAANAFAISIGAEAGFNIAREFLPAIFHSLPPVEMSPIGIH